MASVPSQSQNPQLVRRLQRLGVDCAALEMVRSGQSDKVGTASCPGLGNLISFCRAWSARTAPAGAAAHVSAVLT